MRRGFKINKGQKILIVEDVITTGKSSLECSKLIKKENAEIIDIYTDDGDLEDIFVELTNK